MGLLAFYRSIKQTKGLPHTVHQSDRGWRHKNITQMFPIRCYTCNAVVAQRYSEYSTRRRSKECSGDILNSLHITRMCCRRMFISYVESLSTQQLAYPNENLVLDKGGTVMFRRCEGTHVVSCD
jgi:DNA-directed RNA polymerase subunit N